MSNARDQNVMYVIKDSKAKSSNMDMNKGFVVWGKI